MDKQNPAPKRSVGRPRAFDREQALEIALDRFWRHGFEGVSTTQLCEAMGINPPSLYAAFGSKEALYRECLDRYVERYGAFLFEAMGAALSARQAVERMLMAVVKQYVDPEHAPGCMVSNGGLQISSEAQGVAEALAERRRAAQQAIHERLKRAQADGELAADEDVSTLAAYFATVIHGLALQARDGARLHALRRMAQLALRVWPDAVS